jgi:hypothetical protein
MFPGVRGRDALMRSAGLRRAEQRFRLHTAALALNRINFSEHKYICMCSHAVLIA